jgi:hypothetical protein
MKNSGFMTTTLQKAPSQSQYRMGQERDYLSPGNGSKKNAWSVVVSRRFRQNTHLSQVVVHKVSEWVNKLKNAYLPVRLAWKVYKHQLWPGVSYSIATLANRKEMVDYILHKLDFKMLSVLGVNQHIKVEWRCLGREFGGIGLFNFMVEQFIGWIKIMPQHFYTATTLSHKITASIEALKLEVGCRGNPMNENYVE